MADTTPNRSYPFPEATDDVRPYEDVEALATAVDADVSGLIAPGWTSYVPTWLGSFSNPAKGNGTLTARYRRADPDSDLITVEVYLKCGSTTTYGSGFWSFSLPVNASADSVLMSSGTAYFYDVGTTTRSGACRLLVDPAAPGGAGDKLVLDHPTLGVVTGAAPHAWANTDILSCQITYEPA